MKTMRKLLVGLLVLILMAAFVSCDDNKNVPDEITVSTWDGTSADTSWYEADKTKKEYTLTSAAQLAGLMKLVNDGTDGKNLEGTDKIAISSFSDVTIKLACDIDLNNKQWTPIGLYDPAGEYKEIDGKTEGKYLRLFSGTFDGQGHTISGLYYNGDCETIALFGLVDGTIKNFTVKGEITAKTGAGVVGALEKGGVIENVTNYVNVTSNDTSDPAKGVGGITYANKMRVNNNKSGWTIKNCRNYGNITAETGCYVGGIGGLWSTGNTDIVVENCENYGTIKGKVAGGIVGVAGYFTFTNCNNYGSVTATKYAGGMVGYGTGGGITNDGPKFSNCKNEGKVAGQEGYVGSIFGYHNVEYKDGKTTITGLDTCTGDDPKVGKDGVAKDDSALK